MTKRRVGPSLSGLAAAASMPLAALLVHQLRFTLAYGGAATAELQRQGHAYLHSVVPWAVVLLGLALGLFLRALGRAAAGQTTWSRYTLSFAGLWLGCATCLIAIYVVQELLEGMVATGHPAGMVGVFGYGGWWAIPAACCVGLVLAALFHGARWALREVAARFGSKRRYATARLRPHRPRDVLLVPMAPIAGGSSGRGPPC